ncbi:MAG: hypothetical protein K2Y18_04030 [Alphaproteobacteria bacterium]|jgi:hypothetical protein|nr:hypothetical protein [Alphaproteobacteria bacterium]
MIVFNKNISKIIFTVTLSLLNSYALKAMNSEGTEERPVHYFTAPQLEDTNRGEEVYCVRPVFSGSLDMSSEVIGGKHVISTSGFGGSGITLSEGAVEYQIQKFITEVLPTLKRGRETPITVLGAGWVGSLTALHLQKEGFKNLHIIAESLERITSFNAGGLIAPVSMQNSPEFQVLVDQFGVNAYKGYRDALAGRHPFINADNGQSVMPVPYYTGDRENSGLEPYVTAGVMRPAKDIKLQILDTEVSHDLVCYEDGIFVNTPSVLQQFYGQLFRKFQIPLTQRLITEFSEIEDSVIFNCAGIRAADMKERRQMRDSYRPTLGHLIMGKDQEPTKELSVKNSMILTYGEETKTPDGLNCTDSFYSFPKHYGPYDVVFGGTFIEGVAVDHTGKLDPKYKYPEKLDLIWDSTRKFFGASRM